MHKQRDVRIRNKIIHLLAGRVCSHDNDGRAGRVWRRGQVGVVHEGDVGDVIGACCQM